MGLDSAVQLESKLRSLSQRIEETQRRADAAARVWATSYKPMAARIAELKNEDVVVWEGRLSMIDLTSTEHGPEYAMRSLLRLTALPFLPEPAYRAFVRNVPGDAGFDPFSLAGRTPSDFMGMLEAEIKHGRLAMLAGVGMVAPELFHRPMAEMLGLPNLMGPGGCAPTPLNGQLADPTLAASAGAILGLIAVSEISQPRVRQELPGYFGFDPLQLSELSEQLPKLRSEAPWVAEAEVKHGRVAMLAVTYMAVREYYTQSPMWPAPLPTLVTSVAETV